MPFYFVQFSRTARSETCDVESKALFGVAELGGAPTRVERDVARGERQNSGEALQCVHDIDSPRLAGGVGDSVEVIRTKHEHTLQTALNREARLWP
jgi:hypothetical protein